MGRTSELSDFDRREIAILIDRWMRLLINRTVNPAMSHEFSSQLAKFLEEHAKFARGKLRTCDRTSIIKSSGKIELFISQNFKDSNLSMHDILRLIRILRLLPTSHQDFCTYPAYFNGSGAEFYLRELRHVVIYYSFRVNENFYEAQQINPMHRGFSRSHARWLVALRLMQKIERAVPTEFAETFHESIESFIENRFDGFVPLLYADWLEEKGFSRRAHRIRRGVEILSRLEERIRATEGISRFDSKEERIE